MPVLPAIGIGLGAAGSGAATAGGKKASTRANDLAQQQLQLQQQQFGLAKQQIGLADPLLGKAGDYWKALLQGGQAAVQATGPYASLIGQAGAGSRQAIAAGTARGGEQNLAIAQSYNQQANNVARLYAGMQPLAAQGLGDVARAYIGAGSAFNPSANIGGAFGNYLGQQQLAQQGVLGFGGLIYQALQKLQNRGGGVPAAPTIPGQGLPPASTFPLPTPTPPSG